MKVDKKRIKRERERCKHLWESRSRRNGEDGAKTDKSETEENKIKADNAISTLMLNFGSFPSLSINNSYTVH
jgi:hypothetical protein